MATMAEEHEEGGERHLPFILRTVLMACPYRRHASWNHPNEGNNR